MQIGELDESKWFIVWRIAGFQCVVRDRDSAGLPPEGVEECERGNGDGCGADEVSTGRVSFPWVDPLLNSRSLAVELPARVRSGIQSPSEPKNRKKASKKDPRAQRNR